MAEPADACVRPVSPVKQRLDVFLVENGLVSTRSRAQALIMAKQVVVNGRVETKSGFTVAAGDQVRLLETLPYVSRGGLKLRRALEVFHVNPEGWVVADIGASTGGFTDCWLKAGATQVYAVDVGYGQLDWSLRQDPRVTVLERTNARYLTAEVLGLEKALDGASIDASFIGLKLLLAPLVPLLGPEGVVLALVKPQFEAGPGKVGKGGVVREPAIHAEVLARVMAEANALGYGVRGLTWSPIRGPEGNIEFLMYLGIDGSVRAEIDVETVVQGAWQMGESNG